MSTTMAVPSSATALESTLFHKVDKLYQRVGVSGPMTDQSQLEAVIAHIHKLNGEDPGRIFDRARKLLREHGWHVSFGSMPDATTNGYTAPQTHSVRLARGESPAQNAYVILHEASHIGLGHVDNPLMHLFYPEVQEAEAEVCAFIVAGMQGLDVSEAAVAYVANWAQGDLSLLNGDPNETPAIRRDEIVRVANRLNDELNAVSL